MRTGEPRTRTHAINPDSGEFTHLDQENDMTDRKNMTDQCQADPRTHSEKALDLIADRLRDVVLELRVGPIPDTLAEIRDRLPKPEDVNAVEGEDPDEALARVARDEWWASNEDGPEQRWRNIARAARKHIEAEREEGGYNIRRAERARLRAIKAEAERDALRERLDALATPEHDAAVAAEWADHFEIRQGMVGTEQLTVESMIAALRGPRPFGCEAGESGADA